MYGTGMSRVMPESVAWQDYRAGETGMVVFYPSDPVSEMPIREIPEEVDSEIVPEPHYETGTYGLYGCSRPKIRTTFAKNKHRYLFFMTKYAGANPEFADKMIVTGYYRIVKTADVKKLHIRMCTEYACLDSDECLALLANEVRFVPLEDALVVDQEVLEQWDYKSKLTRQTRIVLDEEPTAKLLEYLRAKPDARQTYVDETRRLQPHDEEEEDEEMVSTQQGSGEDEA